MTTKKHAEHHEEAPAEPKLTAEAILQALAVSAYLAKGTDPIAEEHARVASAQAAEVIRRYARQHMKLDDAG